MAVHTEWSGQFDDVCISTIELCRVSNDSGRDPSINGKSMWLINAWSNGEEALLHALRNKLVALVFIYKFWSISR
jgi:hypothetical protein